MGFDGIATQTDEFSNFHRLIIVHKSTHYAQFTFLKPSACKLTRLFCSKSALGTHGADLEVRTDLSSLLQNDAAAGAKETKRSLVLGRSKEQPRESSLNGRS